MSARKRPPAQLPAPTVLAGKPRIEHRLLPAPPRHVRRLIAAHLRERHGIQQFRLDRHVYLGGGGRRRSQRITWDPSKSTFLCSDCPGEVFWSGEWTEEILDSAELFEPALQARLAGIHDPEERALARRLHCEGSYARSELERTAAFAYHELAAHSRPSVDARREQLQGPLLDALARLGSQAKATRAVYQLQFDQPELWQQLVGRPLSEDAVDSYWKSIPQAKKLLAKRRYQQRRDT